MNVDKRQFSRVDPIFISHGSPDILLRDLPAKQFMVSLGSSISPPKGIIVVSAHWEQPKATLTVASELETIHDFFGFPPPLFEQQYKAHTKPWLINEVTKAFSSHEIELKTDNIRGLDHGAWVPLKLIFPNGEMPIVQLSLKVNMDPYEHFLMGKAIGTLANKGILIIGSGAVTHNLKKMQRPGSDPDQWSVEFVNWLTYKLKEITPEKLISNLSKAPHLNVAHPTIEHLMPLFVVLGAAGEQYFCTNIHNSFDYGSLSMAAYRFEKVDK
ncbi:MAG: dioxygenase [Magnetococcales bacterium]|nr:dioxygenase [Magnetococcales bacterium]